MDDLIGFTHKEKGLEGGQLLSDSLVAFGAEGVQFVVKEPSGELYFGGSQIQFLILFANFTKRDDPPETHLQDAAHGSQKGGRRRGGNPAQQVSCSPPIQG